MKVYQCGFALVLLQSLYEVRGEGYILNPNDNAEECKCVTCEADDACGGLWRGSKYKNYGQVDLDAIKIHVVVSHCRSALGWLDDFLLGYDISSMHVLTKCGEAVEKIEAPEDAKIIELLNVGGIEHSYAYYIANIFPDVMTDKDAIVVFLKDEIVSKKLNSLGDLNTFDELLYIASSDNGFGCGILPNTIDFGQHQFLLSAYHEVQTLNDYSIKKNNQQKIAHDTLGDWWAALNVTLTEQLVQVCYGNIFATSASNIIKRDMNTWKAIEVVLANNIQQGQYAERTWAALLSKPLQPFQMKALFDKSDGVYFNKNTMHGALMSRPKLYLHIGVYGTYSTELLTEYLMKYESLLKLDGYNIALHGKSEDADFPNIDRLASCMWSDLIKSTFPTHQKDATICPDETLTRITEYMDITQRKSNDLIMLNPWLVRPGTAHSLGIYINPLWEVDTVIYYRRYYEWITLMVDHWRSEFLDGSSNEIIPYSTFRYIDFLREYNKRLFYGKNVNEDPVRDLHLSSKYDQDIVNVKNRRLKVYADQFELTSSVDIQELTDLKEYTYFVAKQYNAVPMLRHVTIVNYHDKKDPVFNFLCNVLDHADNSCKAVMDIQDVYEVLDEPMHQEFAQASNSPVPFKLQTALEDIVISAYGVGKLNSPGFNSGKERADQFQAWITMTQQAMEDKDMTVEDLPFECLYDFEGRRLLQVSLEYEKSMLPKFFESVEGEEDMKKKFKHWRFCSVDTKEIIESSSWSFLFDDADKFVLSNDSE